MQPSPVQAQPTEEAVKAALIFNLTKFVEWPPTAFSSPHAPLVVAILGKDAVGDLLVPVLLNKIVNGHPIRVKLARTPEEARSSQVVYVARSEQKRVAEIIEALRGASTLSVADLEHFAALGGHVNLVLQDQRVHILVNPTSAEASKLKISARLLSVAQIVETAR